MNAPDRFELFVLPDGVKKYAPPPHHTHTTFDIMLSCCYHNQPADTFVRDQLQFIMSPTKANSLTSHLFFLDDIG